MRTAREKETVKTITAEKIKWAGTRSERASEWASGGRERIAEKIAAAGKKAKG